MSGLDLGADDYVTKPFSLRELAARVRAVLRRRQAAGAGRRVAVYRGGISSPISTPCRSSVDGQPVRLTRREFELLRCLVENRNRVLSRDRLLERVWGYEQFIETRSVDVHVGRLRSKLGPPGRRSKRSSGSAIASWKLPEKSGASRISGWQRRLQPAAAARTPEGPARPDASRSTWRCETGSSRSSRISQPASVLLDTESRVT